MPRCPECDARIEMEDDAVESGELLDCPECGVELEVVEVGPVVLDLAPDDDGEDDEEE